MVSAQAEVIPLVSLERAALESRRRASTCAHLFGILDSVMDPEIPNGVDLGFRRAFTCKR